MVLQEGVRAEGCSRLSPTAASLLLALLTAQLPFGVSVSHGFGRWSAVVRG